VKFESSSNLVTPALRPTWAPSVLSQLNSRATFLLDFLLQTDVQTSKPSRSNKLRYKLLWIGQDAAPENSRAGEAPCEP
jgi:hypothetical protein